MLFCTGYFDYQQGGSSVFLCFLDAPKAFDLVLFLTSHLVGFVVRFLSRWYSDQELTVHTLGEGPMLVTIIISLTSYPLQEGYMYYE